MDHNYLAHEFFNRDWTPFYHADVVRDFTRIGLSFACSGRFEEFKDSFRFSAPIVQLLNEIADPVMRETVKDFAANQHFRADVFTRGRSRLPSPARLEHVVGCRFALVVPRDVAALGVLLPVGAKKLLPELYDPILCALEKESQSLEELYRRPEIARFEGGTGSRGADCALLRRACPAGGRTVARGHCHCPVL